MTDSREQFEHHTIVDAYAKVRPSYPPSLFEKLASLSLQHERAWDVGCGNGQATISIAEHYKSVVATDLSSPQLARAFQRPNVTYKEMSATPESAEELERVVGPEGSVDLVTVATALHWFDQDKFYPFVKKVLRKPGGVFAAWTYSGQTVRVSPEFDEELHRLDQKVQIYRSPKGGLNIRQYKNLPFPFEPVAGVEPGTGIEGYPMEIEMEHRLSFDDFMTMLRSGPPLLKALEQGVDLLNEKTREALSKAWGVERVRTIIYPLYLLLGTVSGVSAQ